LAPPAVAAKLDRPKLLTELAAERIRDAIVDARLSFGEQISESALAAQLGISKTPVREALLRLKLDGLVDIHPQRGTFVFRLSEDEVAEICRFREILESAALAEAMAQDRRALLRRLDGNLAAMTRAKKSGDARKLPQLDAEFHNAILDACGNAYLRAAYGLIEHKIHALRWRLPEDNEQITHCQHNHAVIVSQIRRGSVGKAQTTLKRHIRDTLDAYLEASRGQAAGQNRLARSA
jgi:DNA-binding GntR family transcriptional regulator